MTLDQLIGCLRASGMVKWARELPGQLELINTQRQHGDLKRWQQALASLPDFKVDKLSLDSAAITAEGSTALTSEELKQIVLQLSPWRKGPYQLAGVYIDSEWRSDFKWQRIEKAISPLVGRSVLDIGCGNGYFCWRIAAMGCAFVLGIDPNKLFVHQFKAVEHFMGKQWPVKVLPFKLNELPDEGLSFDTVFSMGVLYHRKSPIKHLQKLKSLLSISGELVLETLVVEGGEGYSLVPDDRYAKMGNVWFIPSVATLRQWMRRLGFADIQLVDVSVTSTQEQRQTEWMQFESLGDFLDPRDPSKTLEGYPAPKRAILIAKNQQKLKE